MSIVFGQVSAGKPETEERFGMVLLQPMANVKVTYGPDKINNFPLISLSVNVIAHFTIIPCRFIMGCIQLLRSTKPILPKKSRTLCW